MIRFGEGFWRTREAARNAEWLETDGLGGYASSTLSGLNTRRYHGLLVAATDPPCVRNVLLSKLEETLRIGDLEVPLSVNQYPDSTSPEGDVHLRTFAWEPFPSFVYEAEGVRLRKTLFLVHGEGTLVVTYTLEAAPAGVPVRLDVRPLLAFRDYHSLGHESGAFRQEVERGEGRLTVRPFEGLPALTFAHGRAKVHDGAYWYRRFVYQAEKQRGFDFEEDLFSPFSLEVELEEGLPVSLVVSTSGRPASEAEALRGQEFARREKVTGPKTEKGALRAFRRAADQFLVARGDGSTVIAGYPWFTDWGRDTMIALSGLTLATERPEIAKRILATFAGFVDGGMIPNRFLDAGTNDESEYNTVDATLWFVEAVRAYHEKTNDEAFLRELFPTLVSIVDAHVAGTRYGIRVDDDGLLASGAEGVQLTWMDAKVGDRVVTPRRGKPVEIQALWFNAVSFLEKLAERLGNQAAENRLKSLAERAQASFDRLYWNEEAGCLYDSIDEHGAPDPSIRPNQIFAVSLPFPLLKGERAARLVSTVERHLLTPFGLRTLAPSDPAYEGRYEGGPAQRDGAYHQGTVWPWLIGPFVIAYLKTRTLSTTTRLRAVDFLKPLVLFMRGPGLGQLPEILDGDVPRRPAGCFAQAWSVAQVYEAILVAGLPDGDSAGFRALGQPS